MKEVELKYLLDSKMKDGEILANRKTLTALFSLVLQSQELEGSEIVPPADNNVPFSEYLNRWFEDERWSTSKERWVQIVTMDRTWLARAIYKEFRSRDISDLLDDGEFIAMCGVLAVKSETYISD